MRLGVCVGKRGKEYIPVVKNAGYDYIEGTFNVVKSMEKKEFDEYAAVLRDCGIKAETFNGYFPKGSDIRVVGESADFSILKEYSKIGFERAAVLGGKLAVIGSGKSRYIPDGFPIERAKEQYAEFLNFCGDLASGYGMTVVIEPLNRNETNFINTIVDGFEMCEYAANKNVFLLADFFHMYKNNEDVSDVVRVGKALRHVHIARQNDDRKQPSPDDACDTAACAKLATALKQIGYGDRITLECAFKPDFETGIKEAFPILELFRRLYE